MNQLSFFSADSVPPAVADLAGVLAASGQILLVGAPAYFAEHGRPQHPRDLAGPRGFQYSYTRGGNTWRFRHPRHGEYAQTVPRQLQANNAEVFAAALRVL